MKARLSTLIVLLVIASLIPGGASVTASEPAMVRQNESVMFIENVGQFPEAARFRVYGGGHNLWLAEDGLWLTVLGQRSEEREELERTIFPHFRNSAPQPRIKKGVKIKLSFVGANPQPRLEPFDRLDTKVSYFIGNDPEKWHSDVPVWGGVRYKDLYPGVDLEVNGENGRWTWRMMARDNADLSAVRLRVEGADTLTLDGTQLHLATPLGEFTLPLLAAADWSGSPAAVSGHDVLYPLTPLVDPSVIRLQDNPDDLLYSTFLGGSDLDIGYAIAVDGSGNTYITGETWSFDFPITSGALDTSFDGFCDMFVVKMNATGTDVIYATYLGGSSTECTGLDAYAIALDEVDNAYITGRTDSPDFPSTPGAFDTSHNGHGDAFVVKLNTSGTELLYSTFLGGIRHDWGVSIVVGENGTAYLTGGTYSFDFPTTTGAFDTDYNGGGADAFVAKVNASGTALVYATFLGGGREWDDGYAITVDGAGSAYVTGGTSSSDFPITPGAFDTSYNGWPGDAFVAKLNISGTELTYATFLGGSDGESSEGVAVDSAGNAYITGSTHSSDFPTTAGAFDASRDGYRDAFAVKLDPTGSTLLYATFLGGSHGDGAHGIVVNGSGVVYITGHTTSFDFPTTPDAFDTTCGTNGGCDYDGGYRWDAFVVKVNATGSALSYATFLGGSEGDIGWGIAVDTSGMAYITGQTESWDFPTKATAFDRSCGTDGNCNFDGTWYYSDAFVAKLAMGGGEPGPTPTPKPTPTPIPTPSSEKPPVILVHGWQIRGTTRYCSDGVKRLAPGVTHTFGEMAQWFVDVGYDVWIANLDSGPWHTPTIEKNAQCLKDQITSVRQQTGQEVTLVGHSMGGLVSRACLSLDDCRDNVAAFYSLGSPHAGINSAFLLKLLAYFKAPVAGELVCEWQPAMCQFTTDGMVWFNLFNPNRNNGIAYSFIGGNKTPFPLGWLLLPFDGPNDGVVGGYSAVGWLYPTKLDVVRGPEANRYWTNEAHTRGFGSPTYFEASGGPESEAFRCIAWGDCLKADDSLVLSAAQTEPTLSATTVDVIGHLASGQSVSHTLQVDTSDHSLFYLSWLTGTLSFTITQPDDQVITPAYAEAHQDVVTYATGLGDYAVPPFAVYAFTNTLPGHHIVTISADEVGSEGTGYLTFAALETDRTFAVSTDAELYQVGDTAFLTGTLQGSLGGIAGADVQVRFTRMDNMTETLTLADLGGGTYQAHYVVPDAPGYLQATFTAVGDDDGTTFNRQVDELLTIAPYTAQLVGTYADRPEDRNGDGFDDVLALDVGVTTTEVGTYTLSADLAASGEAVAHAAEYIVLASGTQTITLGFDGWDIRRSQISGPYTVTYVSLVDLGVGGVPAQMADNVWMTASYKWQDFGFERLYLPLIIRNY